jgi:CRISPR-associated protein Cmr6
MYNTAPKLTELLLQQHQKRNQSELFRQGQFTVQWRAKVGSFPAPDTETIISAGEPCGAWHPEAGCPGNLSRPEAKRNVGDNWNYFSELPLYGYIPASSIRGLVRSWVLKQRNPELTYKMQQLLGFQQNDAITAGKIEFFDAWPIEPTKLSLDIVNPQEPFQVFHQGQSTPLSFYTLGDGDTSIPVKVAIGGIHPYAKGEDVDTVWGWVEQALSVYGVGSRTASGYGSLKPATRVTPKLEPEYTRKTFSFTLYNQGCAGPNINTMELRPSHWRGWLRSWALRFFLGVMSEDNAKRTVGELFGTIEPEAVQGCVRLKMIKSQTWGERSQTRPYFYTWKGQIEISAPKDILNKIILPIVKFAVSVGGVGRGWRRPLHIFTMRNGNTASRGTHLRLTTKDKKTGKRFLYGINPAQPEQWQQTYQNWRSSVQKKWTTRIVSNANRNLTAEVFAPHTCAIYIVPYPVEEPIDIKNSNWKFTAPLDTRGEGIDLIYQDRYKRQADVGGNAAGGGNSHCSWVSIKRVNIPPLNENIDSDCQEIVCLFLGGTEPNSQGLRARFLRDLRDIDGAIRLFGVAPN